MDFIPEKSTLTPKYNALSAKNLSKKNVNMFRSVNKELMNKKVGKDLSLKMDRLLRLSIGEKIINKKNCY